jgi:hypothetical protein
MEKIMSKSNDASRRELISNELAAVSGGADVHIERVQTTVTTATSDGLLGPSTLNAVVKSILGLLR